MFVGHYSAALAARALKPSIPLGLLFVAVQLIDYAFVVFVMMDASDAGVLPVELHYMPFSHGAVAVSMWALAAGLLYVGLREGGDRLTAALVVTAAVVSHVLLDMVVQTPNLPIGYGETQLGWSMSTGPVIGQAVEIGLLLAAFACYMWNTAPKGRAGQIAPWLLLGLMLGLQAYNLSDPVVPGQSIVFLGVLSLSAFTLLAVVAGVTGNYRVSRNAVPDQLVVPVRSA